MYEHNVKIAKYLGYNKEYILPANSITEGFPEEDILRVFREEEPSDWYDASDLLYDRSWDWLMGVVAKMESEGYTVHLRGNICSIFRGENLKFSLKGKNKFDATYRTVTKFVDYQLETQQSIDG